MVVVVFCFAVGVAVVVNLVVFGNMRWYVSFFPFLFVSFVLMCCLLACLFV